jgi:hypothetical protein
MTVIVPLAASKLHERPPPRFVPVMEEKVPE